MQSLLIYNPVSGTSQRRRLALIQQIAAVLRGHGFDLDIVATTHQGSAAQQVREAIASGVELVFACGGDGTIHDVLQGVVGTATRLAPIPLGRGNALCRELRIPLHPLKAAAAYAKTSERVVQVGRCESPSGERYFLLMAGSGPDGALMYRMLTVARSRLGRWAYAVHAMQLLFQNRFPKFRVRFQTSDGRCHEVDAVSVMALRISNLGGIFPGIARGASLDAGSMRLILVRGPALLGLPLWFASAWLRLERWNPLLLREDVTAFHCVGNAIHAQADGEWIGRLPLTARLTEESVTLLLPRPNA